MTHPDPITEQSLIDLTRAGSLRALKAVESGDGSWALVAQVGLDERPLRSARRDVRTWRNLDSLYRHCRQRLGIAKLQIEGMTR